MNPSPRYLAAARKLAPLIDRARAYLDSIDGHNPEQLQSDGMKSGRDPREPGKRTKQEYEDRLSKVINGHFDRQKEYIARRIQENPSISAMDLPLDNKTVNEVSTLLTEAAQNGIELFSDSIPIGLDYTLTNTEAAIWAREYAYNLVKGIDDVSRQALQASIESFVRTPGFTIGDVVRALPYDEQRSFTIATTEITRTYANANQIAGEALAKEFPDVRVIKRWYTNNDDRVCLICKPLDGKEVDIDQKFIGGDGKEIDNPPAHVNCRCWTTTTTSILKRKNA